MRPDEAVELARSIFLDDRHVHGCAETTFMVLKQAYALPDPTDTSAAMALNGGVAYSGGICGAITGAALAVGLLAGSRIDDHAEAKRAARETVAGMIEAFRERYGAVDCLSLLGVPIATHEEHQAFLDRGAWRETCMAQIELVVGRLVEPPAALDRQQPRQQPQHQPRHRQRAGA